MENEHQSIERIQINKTVEIEQEGIRWYLKITDIADGQGMSTELSEEKSSSNKSFYLDYSRVMVEPTFARIHMMPGASTKAPFEEKLARMELWAKAILTFDSLMAAKSSCQLDAATIRRMIKVPQLPRIETAIGDTGNESLISLFQGLKYPQSAQMPKPFFIPWDDLVAIARSGELVQAWRTIKGK